MQLAKDPKNTTNVNILKEEIQKEHEWDFWEWKNMTIADKYTKLEIFEDQPSPISEPRYVLPKEKLALNWS